MYTIYEMNMVLYVVTKKKKPKNKNTDFYLNIFDLLQF